MGGGFEAFGILEMLAKFGGNLNLLEKDPPKNAFGPLEARTFPRQLISFSSLVRPAAEKSAFFCCRGAQSKALLMFGCWASTSEPHIVFLIRVIWGILSLIFWGS